MIAASTVTIARGQDCRQAHEITEPMTVREWVTLNVGEEFPTPMICMYQGKPLLRAQWAVTIIEDDITFIPLPLGGGGGGGKNPLAMIGMVVVMFVAVVAQQYWATALVNAGWGATAAGIVSSLGSAAIMIGGSMLINAVFPSSMPRIDANTRNIESASPTYSLTSNQNQARLYQMIPEAFGTNDMVPDLAAQPWTEFQGNEQFLHMLL